MFVANEMQSMRFAFKVSTRKICDAMKVITMKASAESVACTDFKLCLNEYVQVLNTFFFIH